jgi:hypothetical protein
VLAFALLKVRGNFSRKLLRAVGPESRKYVECSRYDVCLCKVRDGPQFTQSVEKIGSINGITASETYSLPGRSERF